MNAPVNIDYAALIREDTPDGFLVNSRLYQDERVFRDELDRIFHRGSTGFTSIQAIRNSAEQRAKAFWDVAMMLKRRIDLMLALPLASLDRLAIQREIREIGTR